MKYELNAGITIYRLVKVHLSFGLLLNVLSLPLHATASECLDISLGKSINSHVCDAGVLTAGSFEHDRTSLKAYSVDSNLNGIESSINRTGSQCRDSVSQFNPLVIQLAYRFGPVHVAQGEYSAKQPFWSRWLSENKNSTCFQIIYRQGWGAVAFWLPSEKVDYNLFEYVVTVAEVEKKLGVKFDFIPAVHRNTTAIAKSWVENLLSQTPTVPVSTPLN